MKNLTTVPEYRALEVFDQVPAGCKGVLVTNDRFAPHLRLGEFAVVDIADKTEQLGEIYLFRIEDLRPGEKAQWRFVQIVKGHMLTPRPRIAYAMPEHWGSAANMVDGPINEKRRPHLCGGRVIGVIEFLGVGQILARSAPSE